MAYIHSMSIAEHIRDTSLAAMGNTQEATVPGVNARYRQIGALEHYAGTSLPSTSLPSIFIRPLHARYLEGAAGLITASEVLLTRIVYVQKFSENDAIPVAAQKGAAGEIIVNALWEDWNFLDLSLSYAQIESTFVDEVDYEPQEDIFAFTMGKNIFAIAINHETVINVQRKQS